MMVTGFISIADQWIAHPILRVTIVAGYCLMAAVVAILFPDTPDELLRIETAYSIWAAGEYNSFYWPPGNVLTILANPIVGSGLIDDVLAVRLFNLALALCPFSVVFFRCRSAGLVGVVLFTAPYTFLVLSTGSQQGLMIGLFVLLVMAVAARRLWMLGTTALALYLVNPAMIAALPFALLLLSRDPWFRKAFVLSCCAYIPIFLIALLVSSKTGEFLPTLAGNGSINIFLGNNPDPLSHRGVGDLEAARMLYGTDGDAFAMAFAYFKADPIGFAGNLLTKAGLYWMPWDFLRSGMGQGVSTALFTYIGLVQVVIYATFWHASKSMSAHQVYFALMFSLSAWLLYTAFFVKVRFRVPFDILLLLSCLATRLPGPSKPTSATGA